MKKHLPQLNRIYQADCLSFMKSLSDNSIDMVMTSPPYWALRDYGVKGQLGLEPTFEEYINELCDIFDEVKRILKKEGTCWVNMGDTFWGGGNNRGSTEKNLSTKQLSNRGARGQVQMDWTSDYPKKSLCQIPSRFAIEMVNRGWILRNEIIWHKPNCMPSSIKDRFTVDFEKIFFFVKSKKYYFENQREPHKETSLQRIKKPWRGNLTKGHALGGLKNGDMNKMCHPDGRNKRCIWSINTHSFKEAHFAVYPPALIETPIKAGCPEFVCKKCGKAKEKIFEGKSESAFNVGARDTKAGRFNKKWGKTHLTRPHYEKYEGDKTFAGKGKRFSGYTDCGCNTGFEPGVVLDPFMGAGTTALVALQLGRSFLGCELNKDYIKIAKKRLQPFLKSLKEVA